MDKIAEEINHNICTIEKCKTYENINTNTNSSLDDNLNEKTQICSANFCVVCGVNMGDNNPRQLCRKTYCPREDEECDYKKHKI